MHQKTQNRHRGKVHWILMLLKYSPKNRMGKNTRLKILLSAIIKFYHLPCLLSTLAKNFLSSLTGLLLFCCTYFTIARVSEKINKNFLKIDIMTYTYIHVCEFVNLLI